MLKEFSILCFGLLHGAIFGWFGGYLGVYLNRRFWLHRVYLDAQKHCFIAFVMVIVGLASYFFLQPLLLERGEKLYYMPLCVAALCFLLARAIKISRTIDRYMKNWPHSVGRLETISYGNKYINLSGLVIAIILLALLVLG